jgi:hypothetical protein
MRRRMKKASSSEMIIPTSAGPVRVVRELNLSIQYRTQAFCFFFLLPPNPSTADYYC